MPQDPAYRTATEDQSMVVSISSFVLLILLMKEAQRIYLRHKNSTNQQSPAFKSSVSRQLIPSPKAPQPGPGSYQVILPLVKPKYEAIFKNNRSIIIKLNDVMKPPFCSKSARFRDYSTLEPSDQQQVENLGKMRQNEAVPIKNSRRYSFALSRRKSSQTVATTVAGTSPALEQLRQLRGPEWSKYREGRQLWRSGRNPIPGPGSYEPTKPQPHYQVGSSTWQFRSQTRRPLDNTSPPAMNPPQLEAPPPVPESIHSKKSHKIQ